MVVIEKHNKKEELDRIRAKIATCEQCLLHETRTNTVPGEGNPDADIMFIGEAPGKNEDEKGVPFIGRAGGIFDKLLESIALTREDIFLCNILKCRPPKNRNPLASEMKACVENLDLQIETVNPKVISTLGNFSTVYIFEKFNIPFTKISLVKGVVVDVDTPFGPKKIIPVYHPAVATYNPGKMDELIQDFQVIKKLIA